MVTKKIFIQLAFEKKRYKSLENFFLEIFRSEVEDVAYFKIYDSHMNRVFSSFVFGATTEANDLFRYYEKSGEYIMYGSYTTVLSEEGFNFLKQK